MTLMESSISSPSLSRLLTLDVGGTHTRVVYFNNRGEPELWADFPTPPGPNIDTFLETLQKSVENAMAGENRPIRGIGVGIAGQIDSGGRIVFKTPNIGWEEIPLAGMLEEMFDCPVILDNDVRLATLGEWKLGAGKESKDMICILIGTGVGGGIVASGQLLRGFRNTAGEIGHMTLVAGGRPCRCRNRGCFEAYVGGWAIAERAQEMLSRNPNKFLKLVRRAGSIEGITAKHVTQTALEGDRFSRKIMDETARYLGFAMVSLINALGPERLIFGGSVVEGYPLLLKKAREVVHRHALESAEKDVQWVKGRLGPMANLYGAALRIRGYLNSL